MWERYPKPRSQKLEELLSFVGGFGGILPMQITSLSHGDIPDKWFFKGNVPGSSSDVNRKRTSVKGWFDIERQTGRITVFEREVVI